MEAIKVNNGSGVTQLIMDATQMNHVGYPIRLRERDVTILITRIGHEVYYGGGGITQDDHSGLPKLITGAVQADYA